MSYSLDDSDLPGSGYTIDFYANSESDGSQTDGARYLGSINNYDPGIDSPSGTLSGITLTAGEYVTLVTTDNSGNSSEFSNYAIATDSDAGGSAPDGLLAVTSQEGGLSINQTGDDTYLKADDGGAILGGLTDRASQWRRTHNKYH